MAPLAGNIFATIFARAVLAQTKKQSCLLANTIALTPYLHEPAEFACAHIRAMGSVSLQEKLCFSSVRARPPLRGSRPLTGPLRMEYHLNLTVRVETMQHCSDPIPLKFLRGQPPGIHPTYGRRIRDAVACGKCNACRANRKNDWTGRLVAEALTSAQTVFCTLTYKKEPERFQYEHVSTMLRKIRDHYQKSDPEMRVRFFCVGERGTLFNRRHWHLLLFFNKPSGLVRWGRKTNPGELWEHWPHGWADIQPLPQGQWAQKIRYCVKYAMKDQATDERYPCKSSLRPGMGDEFFFRLACDMAKAGLVPNGKYTLPNMRWTSGRKEGQAIEYSMTSVTRLNFIEYWRAAWELRYPGKDIPVNAWLLKWDENAVFDPKRKYA